MLIGAIVLCPTTLKGFHGFHGLKCYKGRGIILPGGKREGTETYKETAARELKEELGLIVRPEDLRYLWHGPDGGEYTTFAFLAKHYEGTPQNLGSGEPVIASWNGLKRSTLGAYYEILEEVYNQKCL